MAKIYTSALLTILALASYAAIPVRWTTDAYKVKPLVYECYHGETLDLAAALTAYGDPLNFSGKTARLYWQTNGMASAWWSTNASVRVEAGATNILAAVWSGAYDTGAASVTGFIGVEGENYRAAFQLNFRPSPGFAPNTMPIPPQTIDWAKVSNANVDAAPFALKGSGGGGVTTNDVKGIVEGYGYVTKVVTNGLESASHASETYQPKGNYLTSESDPTWSAEKSGYQRKIDDYTSTNAVFGIITNAVDAGYLCTVEAARGMTNGIKKVAWTGAYGDLSGRPSLDFYPITPGISFQDDTGWVDGNLKINRNYIFIEDSYTGIEVRYGAGKLYVTDGLGNHQIDIPISSGTLALTSQIPAAQIQSDWTQTNTSAKDYIKNKPTIPPAITTYLKSATSTDTSITVTKQDDTTVGLEVQYEYALGTFTDTLASGEIRSITPASSTAIPVTLNFGSDATKAADAMLYVDATALAADVDLTLSGYTFIGDTGYQTATHGKKVIFCFTRINANTVIANKKEY